jgi:putative PIN family toxin of toxin-antitoxin system
MINIVLDTNIIISAALSPKGNPAKILELVTTDDELQFCYNAAVMAEYQEVLSREHLKLSIKTQHRIINTIKKAGILIDPPTSTMPLPDESDRIFYDTAKEVNAYLITGNLKHYPEEPHILLPARFIEIFNA